MRWHRRHMILPLQGLGAMIALLALVAWPPRSGAMLLVPLGTQDVNAVARIALAGGARLLGPGPLAGSLSVVGDRARISRAIGSWTILVVAAPPGGCGAGVSDRLA